MTAAFYKNFKDKYSFQPTSTRWKGYAAIYMIADALKRAKLTGNLEADRDAVRQALLQTDMTTVFGKVKFGNWAGPLGDTVHEPEHLFARPLGARAVARWRRCSTFGRRRMPNHLCLPGSHQPAYPR